MSGQNYPEVTAAREMTAEELAQREKEYREMSERIDNAIDAGIRRVIQTAYVCVSELPEGTRSAVAVQVLQQSLQRLNFTLDAAYDAVRQLNRGNVGVSAPSTESPSRLPYRRF